MKKPRTPWTDAKITPTSTEGMLLARLSWNMGYHPKSQTWVDAGTLVRAVPTTCLSTHISRINARLRAAGGYYRVEHRCVYRGVAQTHYYRLVKQGKENTENAKR